MVPGIIGSVSYLYKKPVDCFCCLVFVHVLFYPLLPRSYKHMAKGDGEARTISKKVLGALPPGMREELDAMDVPRLQRAVTQAQAIKRASVMDAKMDESLQAAKDQVKELSADYKECQKNQDAITSYALHLLDEKGALDR